MDDKLIEEINIYLSKLDKALRLLEKGMYSDINESEWDYLIKEIEETKRKLSQYL